MRQIILLFFMLNIMINLAAQNVGIGTPTPNSNALLEINSSTKGILIPRTSTPTRLTIPAVKGLLVYDTTTSSFWFNDGTIWVEALSGNNGWAMKGNSNTIPSLNFIGTSDNQSLRFRLNNSWAGEWNRNTRNYSMGAGALQNTGTGSGNIAIGSGAIGSNSVSNGIVAIGDSALYSQNSIVGVNNVAVGRKALFANNNGINNTAIGYLTLVANTDGRDNTAIGASALNLNTSGNFNIALGAFTLFNNQDADKNIAIGKNALYNNTTGNLNFAIGDSAMYANTTNCCNLAIGSRALRSLFGYSYYNTAIGHNAMSLALAGSSNTAIGESALKSITNASYNVAVGSYALGLNTTGDNNVAIGSSALTLNSTGYDNIAVGSAAMYYNHDAYKNIAIGSYALSSNSSGNVNIAIGDSAMYANPSNCCNIAIGAKAMKSFGGYGYYNTVLGHSAMLSITSGDNNTAVGQSALNSLVTGIGVTAIGSYANVSSGTISYSTAIGAGATVGCSNCLVLGGNNSGTRTKVGINQSTPFTDLHIIQQSDNGADKTRGIRLQRSTGTNQWRTLIDPSNNYIFEYNNGLYSYIEPVGGTFVSASDARLKKNIQPLEEILSKLMLLRPATYEYTIGEATNARQTGFIAQDVEKLFPQFVHTGQNGYKGIAYQNFGIIAVKAIQEQQSQIEQLKKENTEMKTELLSIKIKLGM